MPWTIVTHSMRSYREGLSHCFRSGNNLTPLAVLYFSLSLLLTILASLSDAWWQATISHLQQQGLNRLTIEATGSAGLNAETLHSLRASFPSSAGFRVVPQLTTVVYLKSAAGDYKPFLASSAVSSDPLLMEAPKTQNKSHPPSATISKADQIPLVGPNVSPGSRSVGARWTESEGVVLSPDILRRLGYSHQEAIPVEMQVCIYKAGDLNDQWEFSLPIAGTLGDLGKQGVRIPLDRMIAIRRYQYEGQESLQKLKSLNSSTDTTEANLSANVEINAIHLQVPAKLSFETAIAQVQAVDPTFQLSSPWFEVGKKRSLLSTALQMVAPVLAILIGANAVVLLVLVQQKVEADKSQLALMKLSGACSTTILAWYALPLITLASMATASGTILARAVVQGSLLPVLEMSLAQPIMLRTSYLALWISSLFVAALIHSYWTHREMSRLQLDMALS